MIAAVVPRYGSAAVVEVREIPAPAAGRGQVLVRVRASSINPLDLKLRSGSLWPFLRLRFPAVLGFDLAGEIVAVGPDVHDLAVGQRVYGRTDASTGGAHAELAVVASGVLDVVPERLSFEQAASMPLVSMTAVQALRDVGGLRAGQRLLVNGAAGGVGTIAVQMGRAFGAVVTGVASGESRALVERLGATQVLDYTLGELDRAVGRFDVVLDATGGMGRRVIRRVLAADGAYITTGFSPGLALRGQVGRIWSRQRIHLLVSKADGALMRAVSTLVREGRIEPVIDSVWLLQRIREAYQRLETRHAHGKVVVTIP